MAVEASDKLAVPPLVGFVMNRVGNDWMEKLLYELLVERDLAFISVGHRPSLKSFHTNVLQLEGNGDWRLMPAVNYDPEAA